MKKILVILCFFAFGVLSCKTKQVVLKTSKASKSNNEAAKVGAVCMDPDNDIFWSDVTDAVGSKTKNRVASKYKLFAVEEFKLRRAMESNFKKGGEFKLGVPVFKSEKIECIFFQLINSETLTREKQMETGHFSFKGRDIRNDTQASRFDFSGSRGLRAYIRIGKETYIFEPIKLLGKQYYISFNKKNSLSTKSDFEREN